MLRYLAVILVVLAIPALLLVPVQSTERQPTMLEVDLEMFQHVEYPCHAFGMIKVAKEWKASPGQEGSVGRKELAVMLLALAASEDELGAMQQARSAVKLMEDKGLDLRTMNRDERMGFYHQMLSACVSVTYRWKVENLLESEVLLALSSVGWD